MMKEKLYESFINGGRNELEILDLFEKYFDEHTDLLCFLDSKCEFIKVNPAWSRVLSYELSDLKNHFVHEFVHSDDLNSLKNALEGVRIRNENSAFVMRYMSKKGEWLSLECRILEFYDMYYLSARDITEHLETKRLLREKNSELEDALSLQKHISEAAFKIIVTQDFNSQLTESIKKICTDLSIDRFLLFLDKEDEKSSILKHYWQNDSDIDTILIEKEITDESLEAYKSLLKRYGMIFSKDLLNLPLPLREHLEKNGVESVAIFPIYIEGEVRGFTRFDCLTKKHHCGQSTLYSLQTLNRILSAVYEKRVLHLRLRKNYAALDTFFDNSRDGFLFMNLEKSISWNDSENKDVLMDYVFDNLKASKVNDVICRQYGMSKKEFLGKTPSYFNRDDLEKGKCMMTRLFDEGFFHLDTEIKKSSGESVFIKGYYVCIYDEEEKLAGLFGVHRDITEERLAQKKVLENEMRFNELANNIEEVFLIKENGRLIYINDAFERVTGLDAREVRDGRIGFEDIVLENDKKMVYESLSKNANHFDLRYRIRKRNGEVRWIWDRGKTYKCPTTNVIRTVGVSSDITVMKDLEERLHRAANIDALTQIYNRRYVFDKLDELNDFAFSILDIDFFKNINDTFGHPAGDFILKDFARVIKENIRESDLLGRYGGEEFVVVFKDTLKLEASVIMHNVLDIIRKKIFVYEGRDITFTFSCGISDTTEFKSDVKLSDIVNSADERLYKAKNTGRDKIVL